MAPVCGSTDTTTATTISGTTSASPAESQSIISNSNSHSNHSRSHCKNNLNYSNSNKGQNNSNQSEDISNDETPASSLESAALVFDVEHLATFSTAGEVSNLERAATLDSKTATADNKTCKKVLSQSPSSSLTSSSSSSFASKNHNQIGINEGSEFAHSFALQKLFELEKVSGIWTQRMQIELRNKQMLVIDCESAAIIERYEQNSVILPQAFNYYNELYNNLIVFTIIQNNNNNNNNKTAANNKSATNSGKLGAKKTDKKSELYNDEQQETNEEQQQETNRDQAKEAACEFQIEANSCEEEEDDLQQHQNKNKSGELNIFQCVSHQAQHIVDEILRWKSQSIESRECILSSSDNNQNQKTTDMFKKKNKLPPNELLPTSKSSTTTTKPIVRVESCASGGEQVQVNVNVKETVQVFNQIAALRSGASVATNEKTAANSNSALSSKPTSPSNVQANPADGYQLYKQRSIRASLVPKSPTEGKTEKTVGHECQRSPPTLANASPPLASTSSSFNNNNNHYPNNSQSLASISAHRSSNQQQRSAQQSPRHTNSHKANHNHSNSCTDSSRSSSHASSSLTSSTAAHTNESYVSVLNHCFDDIEKFIIRLQQAVAAIRELHSSGSSLGSGSASASAVEAPNGNQNGKSHNNQTAHNKKHSSRKSVDLRAELLYAKAQMPHEDDYFEILSKFKLAFNLLAKLKGCIHEPNAPELVHFLFTPLAIIIDTARNANPRIDPTLVGVPYLNRDAIELLTNCCTSKESDMWLSLGPNWTQTVDLAVLRNARLPSSFQPIFTDGWAPVIGDLELIGLTAPFSSSNVHNKRHHHKEKRSASKAKQSDAAAVARSHMHPTENSITTSRAADARRQPAQHGKKLSGAAAGAGAGAGASAYERPGVVAQRHDRHPLLETADTVNGGSVPYGLIRADPQFAANGNNNNGYDIANKYARDANLHHQRRPKGAASAYDIAPVPQVAGGNYVSPVESSNRAYSQYPLVGDVDDNQFDDYRDENIYAVRDVSRYDIHNGGGGDERRHKASRDQRYAQQDNNNIKRSENNNPMSPTRKSLPVSKQNKQHHKQQPQQYIHNQDDLYTSDSDYEAVLSDLGPAQADWLNILQSRGARIVRVLFTRAANNDKELSVQKGEVLELIDDCRRWWRVRNIDLQVGHVPHTIVAEMRGYQTLDELLASTSNELTDEDFNLINNKNAAWREQDQAKTGAFKYF